MTNCGGTDDHFMRVKIAEWTCRACRSSAALLMPEQECVSLFLDTGKSFTGKVMVITRLQRTMLKHPYPNTNALHPRESIQRIRARFLAKAFYSDVIITPLKSFRQNDHSH